MLPVNPVKFLRTTFYIEHLWQLLLPVRASNSRLCTSPETFLYIFSFFDLYSLFYCLIGHEQGNPRLLRQYKINRLFWAISGSFFSNGLMMIFLKNPIKIPSVLMIIEPYQCAKNQKNNMTGFRKESKTDRRLDGQKDEGKTIKPNYYLINFSFSWISNCMQKIKTITKHF